MKSPLSYDGNIELQVIDRAKKGQTTLAIILNDQDFERAVQVFESEARGIDIHKDFSHDRTKPFKFNTRYSDDIIIVYARSMVIAQDSEPPF